MVLRKEEEEYGLLPPHLQGPMHLKAALLSVYVPLRVRIFKSVLVRQLYHHLIFLFQLAEFNSNVLYFELTRFLTQF